MATLTISLSNSSVVNGSKSWTITDADVQTLVDSITEKNTIPPDPAPTPGQALGIWAQGFITTTVQENKNYRMSKAASQLVVPPIVFT